MGIKTASPEADLHIVQSPTGSLANKGIILQQEINKKWYIYSATTISGSPQLWFEYNGANKSWHKWYDG
ncbi:MAG: hypothetical protein R2728_14955 [Chitinophagales bacterium]